MRTWLSTARCQEQNAAPEHGNKAEQGHNYALVPSVGEPGHSRNGAERDEPKWYVEQNGLELVKAEVLDDQAAKHAEATSWDPAFECQ